ncbi:MAG TPA: O-methyltransferase [Acidimicrobiales bacterium]|jgi:predicted O-methyltransferase YrrM
MDDSRWNDVDDYLDSLFSFSDEALSLTLSDSNDAGLPPIAVSASQGRMLELLVSISGARRILEIGTLGGFSAISMARALPADGWLLTLELEEAHARVARSNFERAALEAKIEVRVGPAADSLRSLANEGVEPFDFIFIDANKDAYPEYLELALALSRSGTVMVADNVVREGEVANAQSANGFVQGVRSFLQLAAHEPRLRTTVVQTVGAKGYDGFALLVVL